MLHMFFLKIVFQETILRTFLKVLGTFKKICDSDSKFEKRSAEYQKYLIAKVYKPSKVKKQFSDVRNILREEARRP